MSAGAGAGEAAARHQRLMDLFDEACDLDEVGRAAFVARVAQGEPALGRELAQLLRHDAPDPLGATPWVALSRIQSADPPPAPAAAAGASGVAEDLEIVHLLGQGGMGQVMLARQRSLGREVAVKRLRPEAGSPRAAAGLLAEALCLGSLEHPNIVPVHALGQDGAGQPLLVMKRVQGVPWSTLIAQPQHPLWGALGRGEDRLGAHLDVLGRVCHALEFAHSRGVLHLDIKPQNVMVGAFGEVYLLDWGLATATDAPARPPATAPSEPAGSLVGTPGFMAPEMVVGGPLDVRTDVYLLGATLHYLLTRRPRHEGADLGEVLAAALTSAPVAYGPGVPEELGALCNRATSADAAARPPSAQAFREALGDYLRHRGSVALGEAAAARLERLRALLAAPGADRRTVHELMTESHFGFQQALREWPENRRAQEGLRACLILQIRHELSQENLARVQTLQALLAELTAPPRELRDEVAALEARVRARAAREAWLTSLLRGQDWRVGARQRALFFVLSTALGVGVWRLGLRLTGPRPWSPQEMATAMGAGLLCMLPLLLLFRRVLFATAVNRQLVLAVLGYVAIMIVHRALYVLPVTRTADIVSGDMLLGVAVAVACGLTLGRWMLGLVPGGLAGALAARLWPQRAGLIFAICTVLTAALGLLLVWRRGRAGPAGPVLPGAEGPGGQPGPAGATLADAAGRRQA